MCVALLLLIAFLVSYLLTYLLAHVSYDIFPLLNFAQFIEQFIKGILMNPLSQKHVDLILQQLELLVSSLNKSPQLLTLYTCFTFIDRLAETKRPTLDLAQVQKLIVLLEKIYFIKHKSFPDIHSSYRSLRDVTQIMDSEVNTLAAFYNFLRPQVVKIRRTFTDQFRVLFNQQTGMDYKSSGYDYIGKKESDIITGFWSFHMQQSLLAFRQNKSPEHLDNTSRLF